MTSWKLCRGNMNEEDRLMSVKLRRFGIHQCDTTTRNATRMQRRERLSVSSGPGSILAAVWGESEALSTEMCAVWVNVI